MKKTLISVLADHYKNTSFSAKDAMDLGVGRWMLSNYVKTGKLNRASRGLYIFPDYDADEEFQYLDLVLISKRSKNAVICLISALTYWNLTTHIPREFWLALPNNSKIFKHSEKIRFIRPRDLTTGIIEKVIAGETVKITDRERSVCDAFKYLDFESSVTTLRMYLEQDSSKISMENLLNMAKKLRVTNLLQLVDSVITAQARDYPRFERKAFRDAIHWFSNEFICKRRNLKQ